ncbi:hypothetical protein [Flavihumibacter petaseus]|uniref:Uncharacterized protein n=1 Tax=Flavihumibacter petaseus NBRC 106054 TaxID=1220578 RepID=A0A0E9MZ77_9BACT|nr:hypothetical protein [Flavihumibacter petaseus]GAO42909.1 hypothetical protein FPE01S_02_00140 [Flavihumibacter petaseus NBRC 106054]
MVHTTCIIRGKEYFLSYLRFDEKEVSGYTGILSLDEPIRFEIRVTINQPGEFGIFPADIPAEVRKAIFHAILHQERN